MSLRVLVRVSMISLAALLLIAFALIQFEEHLIRRPNERLLADFHYLRLNQTSWPERQALMQRWGSAGHTHGPCNSIDCAYDITVVGCPSLLPNSNGIASRWLYRLGRLPLLLQFVGLRFSVLELRFLVEDGAVRRTRLHTTGESQAGGYGSALLVTVKATTLSTLQTMTLVFNFTKEVKLEVLNVTGYEIWEKNSRRYG